MAKRSPQKKIKQLNQPIKETDRIERTITSNASSTNIDSSAFSLFWPTVSAVSLALVVVDFAFQSFIATTALRSRELVWGARMAAVCYGIAVLSACCLLVSVVSTAAIHMIRRFLPKWISQPSRQPRFLLTFLVWIIVLFYAASWAKFWHTGKFLSYVDFIFVTPHPIQIFHWIGADIIVIVILATSFGAVVVSQWIPRWIAVWQPNARNRLVFAAGAVMGLLIFGAVVGELYSGLGERQWTRSGIVYAKIRDQNSGPMAYELAGLRTKLNHWTNGPAPTVNFPHIQRPIISMEQYLAGIDRQRYNRWNVIVLIVESLGANQLQNYGAVREVLPNVENLARDSRVFVNAYSQASHTNYATPVPLSGQFPLRSAGAYEYPKNPPYPRVLIYDVLKALGYRTAIFSSSNEYWGGMINFWQSGSLDRFFHAATFKGPTYAMQDDTGFSSWLKETHHAGSVDDRFTMDEALRWIQGSNDEPFFLYMNFQNSHIPYTVPPDFPRRFGPKKIDFAIRFGHIPKDKIDMAKDVYADSLNYVDFQIGRLLQYLRERGLSQRTMIVVTGDHGQAFYEHGFAAHASEIFNEVMKVPLIVHAPGLRPGLDNRPAQHVDIAPSILDLLGLPPHPAYQGMSLFDSHLNLNRPIYLVAQTPLAYQYGIVRGRFKLIYDEWQDQYQLFDLVSDPGEVNNIVTGNRAVAADLTTRLRAWRKFQVDYYADKRLQSHEYPPVLAD